MAKFGYGGYISTEYYWPQKYKIIVFCLARYGPWEVTRREDFGVMCEHQPDKRGSEYSLLHNVLEPAMLLVRTGRDPFGKKVTSVGSILKKILLENRFLSIGRVVFYFTAYFCFLWLAFDLYK